MATDLPNDRPDRQLLGLFSGRETDGELDAAVAEMVEALDRLAGGPTGSAGR